MAKRFSQLIETMPPERQKKIKARADEIHIEVLEYRKLQELRKAREITQVELAERLHIKQSVVSKIESQTDMYVSTLRKVITAMGGEFHILAKFPSGDQYEITQFDMDEDTVQIES